MPAPSERSLARRRVLRVALKLGFAILVAALMLAMWPGLRGPRHSASAMAVPLSGIAGGQARLFEWRSRPVWILHRDAAMLDALRRSEQTLADPDSLRSRQPVWARGVYRSRQPNWLVVIGLGTDLGCTVRYLPPGGRFREAPWNGGFVDTCRGSRYDASGRVFADQPAGANLAVPSYRLDGDTLHLLD